MILTQPIDLFLARMPEEKLERALRYLNFGYSPTRVAQICDIHLSHARVLKNSLRMGHGQ